MDKKLYKTLRREHKINKIKHPNGSRFLACPECQNQMLRGWFTDEGIISLCYECGTLFWPCSQEIVKKLSGNSKDWDTEALATIDLYTINKYDPIDKYDQFASYLRKKQLRLGLLEQKHLKKISHDDMIKSYQICNDCGEEFFSDEDLQEALEKSDTPQETLLEIDRRVTTHTIDKYIESQEYKETVFSTDTWKLSPDYPSIFISPEIREYVAGEVAKLYYDWVMDGIVFVVDHDEDPPWDCSGELVDVDVSPVDKLSAFATLEEWGEEAYTGDRTPTFESGLGFSYDTFNIVMEELIVDVLWGIWSKKLTDEDIDKLEVFDDEICLAQLKLTEEIGKMSTIETFRKGE